MSDLDFSFLDRALENLYRTRALLGAIPPAPATARGRVGAVLVQFVRRALFWLFPQLDAFHGAVVAFAECQVSVMEELCKGLAGIGEELERTRREWTCFGGGHISGETPAEPAASLWLQLVRCQAGIDAVREAIPQRPART